METSVLVLSLLQLGNSSAIATVPGYQTYEQCSVAGKAFQEWGVGKVTPYNPKGLPGEFTIMWACIPGPRK